MLGVIKKVLIGVIVVFAVIAIFIVGYILTIGNGLNYRKISDGKEVYEFETDFNGDGKTEKIEFKNSYAYYDEKEPTCDGGYASNRIEILVDGERMYIDTFSSLNALLNPQIVDFEEENESRKQIYVHCSGGGPAMPMSYYFYFEDETIVLNKVVEQY